MRLIAIDKMRAVWLTTPLCKRAYVSHGLDGQTRYCALSALAVGAGMDGALIERYERDWRIPDLWVREMGPLLEREYGIPQPLACQFPSIFDGAPTEQIGILRILAECEAYNREQLALEKAVARLSEPPVIVPEAVEAVEEHELVGA